MRTLVLRYCRARVWAGLVVFALIGLSVITIAVVTTIHARPDNGPIDPAEALEAGGTVVVVRAVCGDTQTPMIEGGYGVLTEAGRPPKFPEGELAYNVAQVAVGPDWVGRIWIRQDRGGWSSARYEQTDLIGGEFGWYERQVIFHSCD